MVKLVDLVLGPYRKAKQELDKFYYDTLTNKTIKDGYNNFLSKLEGETGPINQKQREMYQPLFFYAYSTNEVEKGLIFKIKYWFVKRKIKNYNKKAGLL